MDQSRKKRYARRLDSSRIYKPHGIPKTNLETFSVSLDEFEAIRLIDIDGLNQIEAAADMQVSRATVQRLLLAGRKKIAEALLTNAAIEIRNDIRNIKLKGENKMNIEEMDIKMIAFPTSDKVTIDAHFGHTKEFAIYEVRNNDIVQVKYVTPPPHEPGVLPRFLGEQGIDVIITGGMGQMAINLFNRQAIDVILGAKGRIDVSINEYLGGFLSSQGSSCDHTSGQRHNHGHQG